MTGITFLRASALPYYADCPRRSAARLFRKEIEAAGYTLRDTVSSIGAPVGSAVHAGAAISLHYKAQHGVLAPESDAIDGAVETLRHIVREDGAMMDRETPDLNTAEQQVRRMTQCYRTQVAPQVEPILIEESLEAEVRPGLVLTGHADVIAREPGKVRDLKSGKHLGSYRAQLGAYSLLARSLETPVNITDACIDFVQRASLKKPQPDAVVIAEHVALAESAASNTIRTIFADLTVFREGDAQRRLLPGDPWAFLSNPNSMLCGPKYCEAAHTDWCRECPKQETTTDD